MQQNSLVMTFILWLAMIGAFRDWRYLRKGGVRPTQREKQYVVIAIVLCVAVMLLVVLSGGPSEVPGRLTAYLLIVIFALWEFRRGFIRAAHPIRTPKASNTSANHINR